MQNTNYRRRNESFVLGCVIYFFITFAENSFEMKEKVAKQKKRMPKRMSKLGMWMMQNKGGIVVDRRAVNR